MLGALTADKAGTRPFTREEVGKITITDQATYVAVAREYAAGALHKLLTAGVRVAQSGAIAET